MWQTRLSPQCPSTAWGAPTAGGASPSAEYSPGAYRIYALQDADQNFKFSQPTEIIAFNDSLIVPHMEERTRQDTVWQDSLTVDTVMQVRYTHFLPDNVLLRCFKEKVFNQRLMKTERLTPEKFSFFFTAPADSLPLLTGLNFDEKDAFVVEQTTGRNDTIHYWVKDTLLCRQDTLCMSLTYLYTDTLNQLVPRTDTLRMALQAHVEEADGAAAGSEREGGKGKEEKEEEKRGGGRACSFPRDGSVRPFGDGCLRLYHAELYRTDSRL